MLGEQIDLKSEYFLSFKWFHYENKGKEKSQTLEKNLSNES